MNNSQDLIHAASPPGKWNSSHLKRIVTSAIGIPSLVILVLYGNSLLFWFLIASCILLGLMEFYNLLAHREIHCFRSVGLGLGLIISIGFWWHIPFLPYLTITLAVIIPLLVSLFIPQDISSVIPKILGTMAGVFYVAWLLSHLIWIHDLPQGKAMVMYLFLIVWAGDSAAFYLGRTFGKHKLSPTISPKKSVEGAAGGMLGSILISVMAHVTFLKHLSLGHIIFLGFFLNLLGQLGDLAESLLKRGAGIKDSGTLIPGHGGILDRIDSLLFAGPALYYYMSMLV
ncbi:MAG: phosphatidate cytidylyltransferase [bacterium]